MPELKMPDINYVMIAGNLTKDPVVRTTTNGTPVANFTIASNRRFRDNLGQWREDVCYIGVVAWYKLADSCRDNLNKGSAVIVEGELQSKSWKTENGFYRNVIEIKARRIQYLNRHETFDEALDSPAASGQEEEPNGLREADSPSPPAQEAVAAVESPPAPTRVPKPAFTGGPVREDDPLKPRSEDEQSASPKPASPNKLDFGYEDLKL